MTAVLYEKPTHLILDQLYALRSRDDVAQLLSVEPKFLTYTLYERNEKDKYNLVIVKKRGGGKRELRVPPERLKGLQRRLAYVLHCAYEPKIAAHGFVRNKSILTNARSHLHKRFVLNVDISDFFSSISFGRVFGLFRSEPFNASKIAAITLAQLCCTDKILPTGAPTSPVVANLIVRGLDNRLMQLAAKWHCTYTRYADDLTFSTNKGYFPAALATLDRSGLHLGEKLVAAIEKAGFRTNLKKARLFDRFSRLEVTGLTVNEFPNVRRRHIRQIRAMLHAWERHGYEAAEIVYRGQWQDRVPFAGGGANFERVLGGKIEFLRMIRGEHDPLYQKLLSDFYELCERTFPEREVPSGRMPVEPENREPTPLRGLKFGAPPWPLWVDRYKDSIFRLKCVPDVPGTRPGESRQEAYGTCFAFRHGVFATAGHNLDRRNPWVVLSTEQEVEPPVGQVFTRTASFGEDIGILDMTGSAFPEALPIPTEGRLPQVGEEVAAIGYPSIALRRPALNMFVGTVMSLPHSFPNSRFIQVSFAGGGGLSGAPVVDRRGNLVGIVAELVPENIIVEHPDEGFSQGGTLSKEGGAMLPDGEPQNEQKPIRTKPAPVPVQYGQVVPIAYLLKFWRTVHKTGTFSEWKDLDGGDGQHEALSRHQGRILRAIKAIASWPRPL